MKRRTVQTIKETFQPKEIFTLILKKPYPYYVPTPICGIRDRAGMSLSFLTGARAVEVFGGPRYGKINGKTKKIGTHPGLRWENLEVTDDFLFIENMMIAKRSQKVIDKYGPQVARRDKLAFPLRLGLFDNIFYDQLTPFSWLVADYIRRYKKKSGKLFPYQEARAWEIIKYCTGMFPNWFRAQADRFYGYYITKDSIRHSKFMGRVKAESSMPYIRYSWSSDLKDKEMDMDFDWIQPAIDHIKESLNRSK